MRRLSTRTGGIAADTSGDLFLAFSTANKAIREPLAATGEIALQMLPDGMLTPIFDAVASATEEAILNALTAAETMTGIDGSVVEAMPQQDVRRILARTLQAAHAGDRR